MSVLHFGEIYFAIWQKDVSLSAVIIGQLGRKRGQS